MTDRSDTDWIRLLKEQDPQAIDDLWHWLYQRALTLTQRRQLPEDLGRDAATAAYDRLRRRGIYQYKFECPFLGYCNTILVRELQRRMRQFLPPLAEPLPEDLPAPEALTAPDLTALRTHLLTCLAKLPAREREVIMRQYFQSQSPQDIAEALGIERNHVNQIAHVARKRLKQCLEALGVRLDDEF